MGLYAKRERAGRAKIVEVETTVLPSRITHKAESVRALAAVERQDGAGKFQGAANACIMHDVIEVKMRGGRFDKMFLLHEA
jgi:hypothetical protein